MDECAIAPPSRQLIGSGCVREACARRNRQDKIDRKTNLDVPFMQTSILAAIATAKAENRFVSDRELQAEEEKLKQDLACIEAARKTIEQDQSLIDTAAKEEISDSSTAKPFWERLAEIGAQVPDSEWAKLPRDLATNFEHYMYGAPKEE